jgi:hypothetical protein
MIPALLTFGIGLNRTRAVVWGRCLFVGALLGVSACQGRPASGPSPAGGSAAAGGAAAPIDLATVDVCQRVPGEEVARAVGGKLVEVLPFRGSEQQRSRCRYSIAPATGQGARRIFVVWLMASSEFDALRRAQDNPTSAVPNLGDNAFISFAPGGQHFDLCVLKRGVATIEVTGEERASAIRVGRVALAHL